MDTVEDRGLIPFLKENHMVTEIEPEQLGNLPVVFCLKDECSELPSRNHKAMELFKWLPIPHTLYIPHELKFSFIQPE